MSGLGACAFPAAFSPRGCHVAFWPELLQGVASGFPLEVETLEGSEGHEQSWQSLPRQPPLTARPGPPDAGRDMHSASEAGRPVPGGEE